MKKILLLSLVSSSIFAMQPNRVQQVKLQDKILKNDIELSYNAKRYALVAITVASILNKAACYGSIVRPELTTVGVITNIALDATLITLTGAVMQNQENNK